VTNTTLGREGLHSSARIEQGGLSGAPLRRRSEAVLQHVVHHAAGILDVISAGGILGPEDVKKRLDTGAALVQIYTGLVFRGPGLIRQMIRSLHV